VYPSASEPLRFYAGLATLQLALVTAHADAIRRAATFSASLDCHVVADAMPALLSTLIRIAPAPLAAAAAEMAGQSRASLLDFIETSWRERANTESRRGGPFLGADLSAEALAEPEASAKAAGPPEIRAFAAEALLQPFAESVALEMWRPVQPASARDSELRRSAEAEGEGGKDRPYDRPRSAYRCPVCAGQPIVAVLREEAHGARRSLVCGFCLTEWPAARIECLSCGEKGFEALPVFRADELSVARIDACERCRTYVKTIDLTRDGTAVPIVDDIATLALDIWAREQGYQRLRPNMLRL